MTGSELMSRRELQEALVRVKHQLFVLKCPARPSIRNGPIISGLEDILTEIEAELSEMETKRS